MRAQYTPEEIAQMRAYARENRWITPRPEPTEEEIAYTLKARREAAERLGVPVPKVRITDLI